MPHTDQTRTRDPIAQAVEIVEQNRTAQIEGERAGEPSLFTCPDCGGTLWQVDEPELVQFRCHVGHALTGELLLAQQADAAENSLWRTIRTLADQMVLAHELAEFARRKGQQETAADFEAKAQAASAQSQALRQIAEGLAPA